MKSKKKFFIFIVIIFLLLPVFGEGIHEFQYFLENSKSEDIETVMKTIHFLDKKVELIDSEHDAIWKEKKDEIESSYLPSYKALDELKPEIWETDKEFEIRKVQKAQLLLKRKNSDIQEEEPLFLANRNVAKEIYAEWLSQAYNNLKTPRTIPEEKLSMESLEYQRNERKWPVQIHSNYPPIPFDNLEVVIDFEELQKISSLTRNIRQEIIDFDIAVRTGKLSCFVTWNVDKGEENNLFAFGISEVIVSNEVNGISYTFQYPGMLLMSAYRIEGTDYEHALIERVSVIHDILPLFASEVVTEKPVNPTFQVIPENVYDKSISLSVDKPELVEYNDDGEIYISSEQEREFILTVTADGGLFQKGFPLTTFREQKQKPVQKIVEEPLKLNIIRAPSIEQIPRTIIKHKGFGVGITTGYPPFSLDLRYAFRNSRIFFNFGTDMDTKLIVGGGFLFDIFSFEMGERPYYISTGLFLLNSENSSINDLHYYVPFVLSCFIQPIPLEIFIRFSPGCDVRVESDNTVTYKYGYEASIGLVYYF